LYFCYAGAIDNPLSLCPAKKEIPNFLLTFYLIIQQNESLKKEKKTVQFLFSILIIVL